MPAQVDLSALTFFAPIAAFLIVTLVVYAILAKTKVLGEAKGISIFIALVVASVFVAGAGALQFVQTIVPWFVILIISLVFVLATTGLIGKPAEGLLKGISWVFVIGMGVVFLVSFFFVFSGGLASYLPGPGFGQDLDPQATSILLFLYSPNVFGAVVLILISAVVAWVLVRDVKK